MDAGRFFLLVLVMVPGTALAQLSNPVTRDSHVHDPDNQFLKREAHMDSDPMPTIDEEALADTQCPMNLELRWQAEVSSSIYSTPILYDLNQDGKSDIIVPSFVHYLEALEGVDGEKLPGWPAYHKSSSHTSPLLYDVDKDGAMDVALATYNGEVLFFAANGAIMAEKMTVPRLRVRKDWFVGLDPDHVDHSHPDVSVDEHATWAVKESNNTEILNLPHAKATEDDEKRRAAQKARLEFQHKMALQHMEDVMQKGAGSEAEKHIEAFLASRGIVGNATGNAVGDATAGSPANGTLDHAAANGSADCADGLCDPGGHGTNGSHPAEGGGGAAAVEPAVGLDSTGLGKEGAEAGGAAAGGTEAGGSKDAAAAGGAGGGAQGQQAGAAPGGEHGAADAAAGAADAAAKAAAAKAERLALFDAWHKKVGERNLSLTPLEQKEWDEFLEWSADLSEAASHSAPDEKGAGGAEDGAGGGEGAAALQGDRAEQHHTGRRLLQADDEGKEATVEPEGGANDLDEDAAASWDVFKDEDENLDPGLPDEYQYDYDDYVNDAAWADEDWAETQHDSEKDYIGIDAHVLCNPVIADIDRDGIDEMIVAASYFFDRDYYDDPEHKGELEEGIQMGKYIAGAIVVFNMETRQVKWHQHLDLTTDATQFRAYIYSAPTVVDLDQDGLLEIVVGTSVGFLYVLQSDGSAREHWPVQMGEVQGHVAVADVNDDGYVEVIGVDAKGSVAVFDTNGQLLWDRHTGSLISQGATVGDVDGDGHQEVVVGTTSGHVWAFRGTDGSDVGNFPFRTHGRNMAPILLVDLKPDRGFRPGLHLVLMSFDGYLYVIDGRSACAEAIDIGETSYSMVLADNVDGGDDLDLVVSTMNGNVYCFQTPAPYHPLKAWQSQNQGRNVLTPRGGREGIYVLPQSRQFRDVSSEAFTIQFEILDGRQPATKPGPTGSSPPVSLRGPYNVTLTLLRSGDGKRETIHSKMYERPGIYSVRVPCPPTRTYATVLVEMVDEYSFYFSDEFAFSFHLHFYRLMKWILVLPLLAMVAALISQSPEQEAGFELPSYTSNQHAL